MQGNQPHMTSFKDKFNKFKSHIKLTNSRKSVYKVILDKRFFPNHLSYVSNRMVFFKNGQKEKFNRKKGTENYQNPIMHPV